MKKVVNLVTLLSLIPLTACGGQANLAGAGQPASFSGQNAYMQPTYNYQAPGQSAAIQPMAPAMAQPGSAPVSQMNAQTAARPAAAPVPGSRTAPTLRPGTKAPVAAQAAAPGPQTAARPAAAPKAAAPSSDSVGRDLINKTREKFNQLQTFSVLGEAFEKNEKGETRIKLKLNFQKPGQIKLELLQHNNSMYNGTKLTYMAGQNSVTGRPGGALSFMKMTLPLSDEKLLTRRGYRLDQVDTNAIVTRLLGNPALTPKILGKTNIGGHEIAVLEFQNVNTFDQKITRELLGIDMQDHFVRIHEMYEGQTLVYSLKITQADYNVPLTAADFEV